MRKINVLIAGRSRAELTAAEALIAEDSRCEHQSRIISNGHADPLHDLATLPDILLLSDIQANEELQTLGRLPQAERPALVVFGSARDAESMRMAMRAGARDYLNLPLQKKELHDIVSQIVEELTSKVERDSGNLHVFINGKGGSGASFIATNIAHGLASGNQKVTLVDLDLQFAGLCRYLDLKPTRDLIEALRAVDDMDEVSALAFTSEHESGLRLLSCRADNLHLNMDVSSERLVKLLQTYRSFNDFVIVDLPRHIDMVTAAVLESANRISVVTQQSFPHLHDTARLLQILRQELGIDDSRVSIIVNRFEKNSVILLEDIKYALSVDSLVNIPNHYRSTAESVNNGVPLIEISSKSNVSKGLRDYCQSIVGAPEKIGTAGRLQSLFRRT